MEKKLSNCVFFRQRGIKKFLMIMKLTCIFILIGLLQISASTYSQNSKLNLSFKKATLREVFGEIEKNSNYKFLFHDNTIDSQREVSLDINASIEEVLDVIFDGSGVDYRILDNNLVVISAGQGKIKLVGKVSDTTGAPLPGVTVVVKGTTNGTITNFDGVYNLSDVPSDGVIQFSFVGMKMQEIAVDRKTTIDIVMEEDAIGIEEVVAIGYGTVKKSDLTGAVGSVAGSLVEERQATQLSQALQGAMSGVMVTRTGNAPGSGATIRIRGITTIGDSNPLIIVDGVPVDDIDNISPNDVESISVLKDAASASIYGARAAAGVILVTTKRAKTNELGLEYNYEYGIEKPTVSPEYLDAVRYMEVANESGWNDVGNGANEYPVYSQDYIENYMNMNKENPDMYPNTDWSALILKSNAPRQSHAVNISAGTEKIRSKMSFVYDNVEGLYNGRSHDQYSIRFTNDIKINKFVDASVDMHYRYGINNRPDVSERDVMYFSRMSAPIYPAMWSDGRLAGGKNGDNIYGDLNFGGFSNSKSNTFLGKASIDIKPFKGLKISAVFSPQIYNYKSKNFRTQIPYYSAEDPTVFEGYISGYNLTSLSESRSDNYKITTQFLINYLTSFGSHNLNVLGGYEDFYAFYEGLGASRDHYNLTTFPYLNLGPLEYRDNSGNAYENAYRSYFGRIMYNYQNKYFVQGNARYDGSSRFHSDYRWGLFPSVSLGWMISEESFMKNIDKLSLLKLRASWGTLGNERIGNYPYQSTIVFDNALFPQGGDVVSAQTAAQIQYAIQNISWETTESYNIGLDSYFFDSKLRLTADYFKKTTKDMLLAIQIPIFMGFENPERNSGEMYTNGWEFESVWNDNIGELNYSISFNISDFKSVMGNLDGTEFLGSKIKIEGSEFNEWYGYKTDGLFQTQEEVASSALLGVNTKPGDVKYVDISGPDGVPDGAISPEYDKVLLGGSLPRYMFGSNIQLSYRNFDFSMVLQGVGKQNSMISSNMVQPLLETWGNVPAIIEGNYWSMYNTEEQNLNVKYPRIAYTSNGINYATSDYWLFDGKYLRLKNITLGYNVDERYLQKLKLKNVRLYTSFSDLFTLSKYPKGWDPEVSTTGYPITTTVLFGLSVKF